MIHPSRPRQTCRGKAARPSGIDSGAVAAVRSQDREWFERHPDRTWYIRRARPGETATRPRWMLVVQLPRGGRKRFPVDPQLSDDNVEHMATHGTVELLPDGLAVWLPDGIPMIDESHQCCLCQEPATYLGVFCPKESFAPEVGLRESPVLYAVCESCAGLPDRDSRIRQALCEE